MYAEANKLDATGGKGGKNVQGKGDRAGAGLGLYRAGGSTTIFGGSGWGTLQRWTAKGADGLSGDFKRRKKTRNAEDELPLSVYEAHSAILHCKPSSLLLSRIFMK